MLEEGCGASEYREIKGLAKRDWRGTESRLSRCLVCSKRGWLRSRCRKGGMVNVRGKDRESGMVGGLVMSAGIESREVCLVEVSGLEVEKGVPSPKCSSVTRLWRFSHAQGNRSIGLRRKGMYE